jgi:hypothetical protein
MRGIQVPEGMSRLLTYLGYAGIIGAIAAATANIDPFNSDTLANFIAITNIEPAGTLYAVAHTNALKTPLYLAALALFGYSQNAVAFVDFVSTIGFSALIAGCVLIWTKTHARPHLVLLPFAWLAGLSPLFILLTTQPGLRNLDIGVSFVWVALALGGNLRLRYRLAAIPLAALLTLNDPWFVTTFAVPAAAAALLVRGAPAQPWGRRAWLLGPILAIAGVVLGFGFRSLIDATGVVRFVGGEQDLRIVAIDRLGFNLRLAAEVLLRFFNAWVFGPPPSAGSVLSAVMNIALCAAGAAGLLAGIRSRDDTVRRISVFTLLAAASGLAVFVLTNAPTDVWSGRYLVFVPIALALGLAIGLSQWQARRRMLHWGVLGLIGVGVIAHALALGDTMTQLRNPVRLANQQRIFEALAGSGLAYGYSDYWNSLNNTFMSAQTLPVRTFYCEAGRIKPRAWWSQSRWYAPNPEHRPSFVLFNLTEPTDLDACQGEKLVQQFGPATRLSIERGKLRIAEVLIWDYDIASKFSPQDP